MVEKVLYPVQKQRTYNHLHPVVVAHCQPAASASFSIVFGSVPDPYTDPHCVQIYPFIFGKIPNFPARSVALFRFRGNFAVEECKGRGQACHQHRQDVGSIKSKHGENQPRAGRRLYGQQSGRALVRS